MSSAVQQVSLSDSQLADFRQSGWLGPLTLLNRRECRLVNSYLKSRDRPAPLDWPKGLGAADRVIYDLASSPKVVNLARSILGTNIILWGAHIVERVPGKAHRWHSDIETVDSTGNTLTIWIGLENTAARSSLGLISGSHRLGKSLQQVAAERGVARQDRDAAASFALAGTISDECALLQTIVTDGQALVFDGRLWHGSLNQQEQATRTALLLQFAASDYKIRMPDLSQLDWPFKFRASPKPPVIPVSGTNPGSLNRIVRPPAEWPHTAKALENGIHEIPRPLQRDLERGWRPTRFFSGASPVLRKLSCHASILEPGCSPHKPHSHFDDEILVILDGQAELVIAQGEDDPDPRVEPVSTGDLAYYPACQFHTIRCAGDSPVSYLMFRWNAPLRVKEDCLRTDVFRRPDEAAFDPSRSWATRRVFEGATDHLDKLHLHFSRVRKAGGYAAHRDDYDVAILLLEGSIDTLGRRVDAPAALFHPARALHGLTSVGETPALYLVVEFHGRYIDATTGTERIRWKLYSLKARIRQAIRWRLAALRARLKSR